MTQTEENKAFVQDMIGNRRRLEDFSDRFARDVVVHEPEVLPDNDVYRGFGEFQRAVSLGPVLYDFRRFDLVDVFGDGDTVFAAIRTSVDAQVTPIFMVEQFTFSGRALVEVRLYVCDAGSKPSLILEYHHE